MLTAAEKSKRFHTWFFPITFVFVLWVVKLLELVFHLEFYDLGVYPRELKGVVGIFLAPLLHGDLSHLFSNSIPLLVLGAGLFYFYKPAAYRVFIAVYLITGLWVWIAARPSYHIGASGVVYGMASFLFFSGLIRRNTYLMAFSLFVVFLYGSLIWGVLPLQASISWESHLMGAVAGLVTAVYYRKIGLQKQEFQWEEEPEEDPNNSNPYWMQTENQATEPSVNPPTQIIYHFKENKSDADLAPSDQSTKNE